MGEDICFEFEVEDEHGWRLVQVFMQPDGNDFLKLHAIGMDKDGGEIPVNFDWRKKVKSELKQSHIS